MARYFISDNHGLFTADIETSGGVLSSGLDDARAESLMSSAVLMAMATLAEGGEWPKRALEHLRAFMLAMQESVQAETLM